MSTDGAYRLERSWPEEEFPHALTRPVMAALQEAAPERYEYHIRYTSEEETTVELYEYVGRIGMDAKVRINE